MFVVCSTVGSCFSCFCGLGGELGDRDALDRFESFRVGGEQIVVVGVGFHFVLFLLVGFGVVGSGDGRLSHGPHPHLSVTGSGNETRQGQSAQGGGARDFSPVRGNGLNAHLGLQVPHLDQLIQAGGNQEPIRRKDHLGDGSPMSA